MKEILLSKKLDISKKDCQKLVLLFGILIIGLFFICKDINSYRYEFVINRSFSPESDEKGIITITDPIILKKGTYEVAIGGVNQNPNNSIMLSSGDSILLEFSEIRPYALRIEKQSMPVQIQVRYDQQSEEFRVDRIILSSDHVWYKETITRCVFCCLLAICLFVLLCLRFVYPNSFYRAFPFISSKKERTAMLLILLGLWLSYPLFQSGTLIGNDSYYHISRINGIAASLNAGYFPTRIHLFTAFDYGYGTGLFYPDVFLYFPAVLCLLGFSVFTTYKILIILINITTVVITYLAGKNITKNQIGGFISAFLYSMASYRLIAAYNRGALGEMLAMTFFPLIIWGLFEIFTGDTTRWWILAMGCTGVVLSHIISTVLVGLLMTIFLVMKTKTIFTDQNIFLALRKSFGLAGLLSLNFLLPLLEQMAADNVVMTSHGGNPVQNGMDILKLLFGYAEWNPSEISSPYIGFPLLFMLVLSAIVLLSKADFSTPILYLFGFSLIGILLSTNIFPWSFFPFVHEHIQFPWRFLGISSILLSLCGGFILSNVYFEKIHIEIQLVIVFICFVSSLSIYFYVTENVTLLNSAAKIEPHRIGNGEYLPINTAADLYEQDFLDEGELRFTKSYMRLYLEYIDKNGNTIHSNDPSLRITEPDREGLSFRFTYETSLDQVNIEVPLFYYKGYKAQWHGQNGDTLDLDCYRGEHGFPAVSISEKEKGEVFVWYDGTLIQKISDVVSFIVWVILLVYFIRWFITRRKKDFYVRKEICV